MAVAYCAKCGWPVAEFFSALEFTKDNVAKWQAKHTCKPAPTEEQLKTLLPMEYLQKRFSNG